MELLKMFSASEIVAQIISFLILLFLLRKFAWGKIQSVLDARKERIASELQRIEEVKRDVALLKSDYESKLNKIEDQARLKIQEAFSEGKRITEEIRKDAYRNAQDIIEQSRANVKYELVKAKQELKEKIIDLVITATESVIQDKLDEEDDKKLVREFLTRIDSAE